MKEFGAKTKNLEILEKAGFKVPQFIGLRGEEMMKVDIKEIGQKFSCEKYAVRSSALIEDTEESSFAGQFETVLGVKLEGLDEAIDEVVKHAEEFLQKSAEPRSRPGRTDKFSIIIQEYIEPDHSGVVFTRNPVSGREMVIEWHAGVGEKLVGGEVKPSSYSVYWNDEISKAKIPGINPRMTVGWMSELIEQCKKIEGLFKFPQDVEFAVKDGEVYILQSRPITTLDEAKYAESLHLDKVLPGNKDYFYAKTEISEIAPRPCQLTLDILHKVYESGGPVDRVYKKYGVKYDAKDFLKIIGNELYVDREMELKTLLPSYSYFISKDMKPKISGLKGVIATTKNTSKLNSMGFDRLPKLIELLKDKLMFPSSSQTLTKRLDDFLESYEVIFEINLLTQRAIKDPSKVIEFNLPAITGPPQDDGVKFVGNSLDIADEGKFLNSIENGANTNSDDKNVLLDKVLKLREYGRWLTVKHVSSLRSLVTQTAKENEFKDKNLVYFCTLTELIDDRIDEQICLQRRAQFDKYNSYNLPARLTSFFAKNEGRASGVSPGHASGKLVDLQYLKGLDPGSESGKSIEKNLILFTQILSPDLTKYFDAIVGIVSENGSMLSHLAIMARERNLPVVVGVQLPYGNIKVGTSIEINGDSGEVKSI